jgi:hypothetical protein
MMNVILGSNDFFGVPFPLVLADQFFHMYRDGASFRLDVFRWDEAKKQATYEVRGSKPIADNITSNPTGIVTFSEADGGFLFKFRPKPGVSQIFGRTPIDGEMSVHITDRSMRVMRGDQVVVTLERNQFHGGAIGVQVGADGSVGIGGGALPAGLELQRAG